MNTALYEIGLLLGRAHGMVRYMAEDEVDHELHARMTCLSDRFEDVIRGLHLDTALEARCVGRMSDFLVAWERHYVRRDVYRDPFVGTVQSPLEPRPDAARSALSRVESAVKSIMRTAPRDAHALYAFGWDTGYLCGLYDATRLPLPDHEVQSHTEKARAALAGLRFRGGRRDDVTKQLREIGRACMCSDDYEPTAALLAQLLDGISSAVAQAYPAPVPEDNLQGVSLKSAAQILQNDDDDLVTQMLRRWNKCHQPKPPPVGRSATDGRVNLYDVTQLADWVVRVEGKVHMPEDIFRQRLATLLFPAKPAE